MKERNYGIDALRLVLMFMVCMLHTLGQGGVLKTLVRGTAQHSIFWLLEVLCYCAVDGFAIISGYTASEGGRKFEKLVDMWFQAFFYSFLLTGIFVVTGVKTDWSGTDLLRAAMPATYNYFWYFSAFFGLFFAIPLVNRFLFAIDRPTAQKALLLLVVLLPCMETLGGAFKASSGYSVIWLIALYCIGLLARRAELFQRKPAAVLLAVWAACVLLTWGLRVFANNGDLLSYVSPTVLLSALILVTVFSRLRFSGKIISRLSPLAFGIYLFQLNDVIWKIFIKDAFAFVKAKSLPVGIACVFAGSALIFLCGLAVEFLRSLLARKLRISRLSSGIVKGINWLLCKCHVILE